MNVCSSNMLVPFCIKKHVLNCPLRCLRGKIGQPYSVTFLIRAPIFEKDLWFGVVSRMNTQKDMCIDDIKLTCLKIMISIPSAIVDIIVGDICGHVMSMRDHELWNL